MTHIKLRYLLPFVTILVLAIALFIFPAPIHADIFWIQERISAPLPTLGNVYNYLVTPDGKYLLYTAYPDEVKHLNLFRVPTEGGKVVQLDRFSAQELSVTSANSGERLSPSIVCCEPVVPPTGALLMAVSPDSQRVLFDLDRIQYSVPVKGGAPVKLVGPMGIGDGAPQVHISPDSRYALFDGYVNHGSAEQLISVPISGGSTSDLGLQSSENLGYFGLQIAPNSQRVVYGAGASKVELYTVPITGGVPLKLNGPLVTGGSVDTYVKIGISPDSRTVVYRADQDTDEVWELYRVSIDGGPTTKLNAPLVKNGNTTFYEMSPDGQRIVYLADQVKDEEWKLYSVPISGGIPIELSPEIAETVGDSAEFYITPDSRRVIFSTRSTVSGSQVALYSIPIEGGTPRALSAPMPTGGSIDTWQLSPDDEWITYAVRTEGSQHIDQFVASVKDGKLVQLQLSADLLTVERVQFTQDGKHLLFASLTPSGGFSLFRASVGGGNAIRLDSELHKLNVFNFDFTPVPGSSSVIYGVSDVMGEQLELFRSYELDLPKELDLPQVVR